MLPSLAPSEAQTSTAPTLVSSATTTDSKKDEAGEDAKLVAVPHQKLTQMYNDVNDIDDVPQLLRDQIGHFFENYKDLEKGKWVKVKGWGNAEEARGMIMASAEAYEKA